MRRVLALSCTLSLAALPAAAQTSTLWRCVYLPGDAPAIGCMLATAGPALEPAPGSGHAPGLTLRIRRDPASLDGETIVIPLHAPPIDPAFAERLARSVMCGSNRGCAVEFVQPPQPR